MSQIDSNKVRQAFSSRADQYDSAAVVQKRVIDRFCQLFIEQRFFCGTLLDVGAGTGMLLESLLDRMPGTRFYGVDLALGMARYAETRLSPSGRVACVCSAAEALPFASSSIDFVVSTSTYQWVDPLLPAFAEVLRVLKSGGRFCFAMYGEGTLHELRQSYKNAIHLVSPSSGDRSHSFLSEAGLASVLQSSGFRECLVQQEIEVELHQSVADLLRSLKRIGAGNASTVYPAGLSGRRVMQELTEYYQRNFGTDSGISASYEVLYGTGLKL